MLNPLVLAQLHYHCTVYCSSYRHYKRMAKICVKQNVFVMSSLSHSHVAI